MTGATSHRRLAASVVVYLASWAVVVAVEPTHSEGWNLLITVVLAVLAGAIGANRLSLAGAGAVAVVWVLLPRGSDGYHDEYTGADATLVLASEALISLMLFGAGILVAALTARIRGRHTGAADTES